MKKDKQPFSFTVQNLGSIHTGEFTQKPLTIFCGPNNSGKTWAMYALHNFYTLGDAAVHYRMMRLRQWEKDHMKYLRQSKLEPETLKNQSLKMAVKDIERHVALKNVNGHLNENLPHYFNMPRELFGDARFECKNSPQQWQEWVKNYPVANIFLMPAERNGLQLLYRELNRKRTSLLHHASKENVDLGGLLKDVMHTRYAKPIADYIDWLNNLTEVRKGAESIFHEEAIRLQKNLAQGRYHLNRQTGDISFKPYQKKGDVKVDKLGLHAASSTVKSLFGLWFYLEHQARKRDVLMIDEPELNIHPENQLLIARLLARLVNAGIQVVISTHSDYIVREFNSLIMLNADPSGKLRKRYKYLPEEVLNDSQVAAYVFENNTIEPCDHKPGLGFAYSTFDKQIRSQKESSRNIYYDLLEQEDEQEA